MTVIVLEDAVGDIQTGRRFYNSREAGIGEYFVESIQADLRSLILYSGVHSVHFGFYRMLAKRFPFALYYEVQGDTALVYAILDLRRDPLWIRKELARRK